MIVSTVEPGDSLAVASAGVVAMVEASPRVAKEGGPALPVRPAATRRKEPGAGPARPAATHPRADTAVRPAVTRPPRAGTVARPGTNRNVSVGTQSVRFALPPAATRLSVPAGELVE